MRAKIFLIFLLLVFSATLVLCAQPEISKTPGETATPTPAPTVTATPLPHHAKAAEAGPIDGNCLACHYNPDRQYVPQVDRIKGHLNASGYCVYCHIKNASKLNETQLFQSVHALHTSKYKDCNRCHRTYSKAELECGRCHAADPFKASNGNVFKIHSPRGVGCKACHGNDFMRIHYDKKIFPPSFSFP